MIYIIRTSSEVPYETKKNVLSSFGIIISHSNLTASFTIESNIDLRGLALNFEWILSVKEKPISPRQNQMIIHIKTEGN